MSAQGYIITCVRSETEASYPSLLLATGSSDRFTMPTPTAKSIIDDVVVPEITHPSFLLRAEKTTTESGAGLSLSQVVENMTANLLAAVLRNTGCEHQPHPPSRYNETRAGAENAGWCSEVFLGFSGVETIGSAPQSSQQPSNRSIKSRGGNVKASDALAVDIWCNLRKETNNFILSCAADSHSKMDEPQNPLWKKSSRFWNKLTKSVMNDDLHSAASKYPSSHSEAEELSAMMEVLMQKMVPCMPKKKSQIVWKTLEEVEGRLPCSDRKFNRGTWCIQATFRPGQLGCGKTCMIPVKGGSAGVPESSGKNAGDRALVNASTSAEGSSSLSVGSTARRSATGTRTVRPTLPRPASQTTLAEVAQESEGDPTVTTAAMEAFLRDFDGGSDD